MPDVEQAQTHRQVLGQGRLLEVRVHFGGPPQQLRKTGSADGNRQRQPHRRP